MESLSNGLGGVSREKHLSVIDKIIELLICNTKYILKL